MSLAPPVPNRPVYLDNQATTRCDPRVLAVMLPFFAEHYGNPHSVEHAMGRFAEDAVEAARAHVATLIGAAPNEVVFTSGATESNNIAIKGAARHASAYPRPEPRRAGASSPSPPNINASSNRSPISDARGSTPSSSRSEATECWTPTSCAPPSPSLPCSSASWPPTTKPE